MVDIYPNDDRPRETFKFTFSTCPAFKFSFDAPRPALVDRPFKRRRALSDVDGDGNEGRKKRRLRLHLITSRLSRPFSQPASNIANRGVAKFPIWRAKQKSTSKHALRKAAIMNRVRKTMDAAKDCMRMQQERSTTRMELKELILQKPRVHGFLLPPSPLGLSNYDALDLEDDVMDDDGDEATEGGSVIYSDFNKMNPSMGDGDDYEYLDALDGLSAHDLPDKPPPTPSEEGVVELLREKEREGDSYFVQLMDC